MQAQNSTSENRNFIQTDKSENAFSLNISQCDRFEINEKKELYEEWKNPKNERSFMNSSSNDSFNPLDNNNNNKTNSERNNNSSENEKHSKNSEPQNKKSKRIEGGSSMNETKMDTNKNSKISMQYSVNRENNNSFSMEESFNRKEKEIQNLNNEVRNQKSQQKRNENKNFNQIKNFNQNQNLNSNNVGIKNSSNNMSNINNLPNMLSNFLNMTNQNNIGNIVTNNNGNNSNHPYSINNSSNNQISDSEVELDFLFNLMNQNNENNNMIQAYNEHFNEKMDIPSKKIEEVNKFKIESKNNFEFQHKKPKTPKNKASSIPHNWSVNNNGSSHNLSDSNSANSNPLDNINNNVFFSKYNASKQLDDKKLSNLKYDLLNKNIEKSITRDPNINNNLLNSNLSQLLNANIQNNTNFPNTNNLLNPNLKNTKSNESSQLDLENLYLNSFLNNKINTILASSNLNEKILLYHLVANSNGTMNPNNTGNSLLNMNNIHSLINNLNYSNGLNNLEQNFQKEVIKFTIENFCKYLKTNGFVIVKQNDLQNENIKINTGNNLKLSLDNASSRNAPLTLINNNKFSREELESEENQLNLNDDNNTNTINSNRKKDLGCPHTDKKHYAKNMCNACYHREGRVKKSWLCPHTNKVHYARGKCRNCYLNSYHKEHRGKKKQNTDNESNMNYSMKMHQNDAQQFDNEQS